MSILDFVSLFNNTYYGTQKSIENGLLWLKEHGASQIDSIKVLTEVLNIPLHEADRIVLNSIAWSNQKDITLNIRSTFTEYLIEFEPPFDSRLNN